MMMIMVYRTIMMKRLFKDFIVAHQEDEDEEMEDDRFMTDCGVLDGQRCLVHSDCYCVGLQRCQRGKCHPQRNRFPKSKLAIQS